MGDSIEICRGAVRRLCSHPEISLLKASSLYRTQPVLFHHQPWFVNGVILLETGIEPVELLKIMQAIENEFGRVRHARWGPRTLDLDLLFFGQRLIEQSILTVPHPRLHERRFVLEPLCEIAPNWYHPALKVSATQLLSSLPDNGDQQLVYRMDISWCES